MSSDTKNAVSRTDLLSMTTDIVSAFLGHNHITREDLSPLINGIYDALSQLADGTSEIEQVSCKPAVAVRKSVTPDYLVCLEDGRKLKMLKRHLRSSYGMTPDEYRFKWSLPSDYPMVAPNYAKHRSEFAKKIGLGRKPS